MNRGIYHRLTFPVHVGLQKRCCGGHGHGHGHPRRCYGRPSPSPSFHARATAEPSASHNLEKSRASPVLAESRLGLFYGGYFGLVGVRTTMLPVWLQSVAGVPMGSIGLVLGMTQLGSVLSGPVFGMVADLVKNSRTLVISLTLAACALYCTLFLSHSALPFPLLVALTVAASTVFSASLPLWESVSQSVLGAGSPKYGRVRIWGSVGFMVTSTAIGQIAAAHGNRVVLPAVALLAALTCGAALISPKPHTPAPETSSPAVDNTASPAKGDEGAAVVVKLLTCPVFALAVLSAATLQASHAMYYCFGTISFQTAGYAGGTIGLLWSVGVLAEILVFAASSTFKKPIPPPLLLMIGGLAGMVRWSTMGLFPHGIPLSLLIVLQALHGFTFGAVHLGAMGFLGMATPGSLRSSAQGMYTAIGDGGAMAFATALSGALYSRYHSSAFLAMGALSAAGFLGALVISKIWNGKELQVI